MWRQALDVVQQAVGKKANVVYGDERPGDVPLTCADITRAKTMLGYEPTTPLEEGMARLVEWYRASGRADRIRAERRG